LWGVCAGMSGDCDFRAGRFAGEVAILHGAEFGLVRQKVSFLTDWMEESKTARNGVPFSFEHVSGDSQLDDANPASDFDIYAKASWEFLRNGREGKAREKHQLSDGVGGIADGRQRPKWHSAAKRKGGQKR